LKNKLRGLDKSSPVAKIESRGVLKKIMSRNQKNSHLRMRKARFSTGIVWVRVYFGPLAKEVFREDSGIRLNR